MYRSSSVYIRRLDSSWNRLISGISWKRERERGASWEREKRDKRWHMYWYCSFQPCATFLHQYCPTSMFFSFALPSIFTFALRLARRSPFFNLSAPASHLIRDSSSPDVLLSICRRWYKKRSGRVFRDGRPKVIVARVVSTVFLLWVDMCPFLALLRIPAISHLIATVNVTLAMPVLRRIQITWWIHSGKTQRDKTLGVLNGVMKGN